MDMNTCFRKDDLTRSYLNHINYIILVLLSIIIISTISIKQHVLISSSHYDFDQRIFISSMSTSTMLSIIPFTISITQHVLIFSPQPMIISYYMCISSSLVIPVVTTPPYILPLHSIILLSKACVHLSLFYKHHLRLVTPWLLYISSLSHPILLITSSLPASSPNHDRPPPHIFCPLHYQLLFISLYMFIL